MAIIGSGQVGLAVASNLVAKGCDVVFGGRDPLKTAAKVRAVLPSVETLTVAEAIATAEAVLLAVPGAPDDDGIRATATQLGDCAGKVVLDATNPLTPFPALAVRWGQTKSGGEILAEALPQAKVYKAFNTVGAEHIARPDGSLTNQKLPEDMLVAGDPDPSARGLAMAVVKAAGFRPHYVGPIRYARNLEAIAELWIHLSAPVIGDTEECWGRSFNFGIFGPITEKQENI